ncbi:MAG: ABC transporter permease subunit [Clostridia bacterium]|nr:ABC transporter permease subunit [Clostridia bacterium]
MQDNAKNSKKGFVLRLIITAVSILLWLAIWELAAYLIGYDFIFVGPIKTFTALCTLAGTLSFWQTVALSVLRILAGLALGILLGVTLAILCRALPIIITFVSVGMTVIRSTPVASIIMILWIIVGSTSVPVVIAVLMVAPIIWQNLMDGYESIDKDLREVTLVFNFSKRKAFVHLTLPTLLRYFVPAALTSVGLAWKSGIAAEIIAYTKNSIGKNVLDAKSYFEADVLLAWTVAVIVISLVFEYLVKYLVKRSKLWD